MNEADFGEFVKKKTKPHTHTHTDTVLIKSNNGNSVITAKPSFYSLHDRELFFHMLCIFTQANYLIHSFIKVIIFIFIV